MHECACCRDKAASHHLPIAAAFWIIPIVSTEECSSLMQNLMQIHCSTGLVILKATPTQYICSLNSIYHPHWLVQWSCHCSCMHIPVQSLWLPGYFDVMQIILFMLIRARHFLERPNMSYSYISFSYCSTSLKTLQDSKIYFTNEKQ